MFLDEHAKMINFVSLILVIVGGINWGLVGLFQIDIVTGIFGHLLGRLVFVVVGVAAGWLIYSKFVKKASL